MNLDKLKLVLKGSEDDSGDVVLNDLKDFVAAIATCLKRVEKKFENAPRVDYRVIDLSHSSACLTIAPVTNSQDKSHGPLVLGLFAKTVSDLEEGKKLDSRITSSDLLEFKKLFAPKKHKVRAVDVGKTKLTDRFENNIDRLLESAIVSEGSARGLVEKINLHGRNEFTLYPAIGGPIACAFKENLFERVRAALKRNVTVHGKMHRFFGSPFPEKATVTDLEVHPSDDELPRLSDLRGALADEFGKEGAVTIVRRIRDKKNGN
jgi:hypothetical protein